MAPPRGRTSSSTSSSRSPLTIRPTNLAELFNHGLEDLVARHHEETHAHLDIPHDVDWPQYRRLERAGTYKLLGAFRGGKLAGYNAFWLQPTIQSVRFKQAINDVLYVAPAERGWAGVKLIREAEPWLHSLGAKRISYLVPQVNLNRAGTNAKLAELLVRLGYPQRESGHAKLL